MIFKFSMPIALFKNDYTLSIFDKVFSIIAGVISSGFYVRYLGLEYKGIYSYINEIATIIALIINWGIYQSYPFYFRKVGHRIYEKYLNIFLQQFILYISISLMVISVFHDNLIIVLVFLQLPFLVLKTQLDNVVLIENIRIYMWTDICLKAILTIIYFLLWRYAPVHIEYLVTVISATNLGVCFIYIITSKYRLSFKKLFPDISFLLEVVRFGFFPMLSALLMTLNYSVDIIFLRYMGTQVELSLYSVSAVIINYVWIIPNAFKDVLISKVARKDADDQVAMSVKMSLLITLVCLIGFLAVGKQAIIIVFGDEFGECYHTTLVLFIGAFSMIFFKMLGVVFVTEGRQKPYFLILLISVIVNLIINYILIPSWGMYGAALASVASYTVCGVLFLSNYCRWKNKKIRTYVVITSKDIQMFLGKKNI